MVKKNNVIRFKVSSSHKSSSLQEKQNHEQQIENDLIEKLNFEKQQIAEQATKTIMKTLFLKDNYTYHHSLRVAYYSMITGEEAGLKQEDLYELELSALFHDIGKIGVPDEILKKPFRLNEKEFKVMKNHPDQSFEILNDFTLFGNIATNARLHHERFDGRGYPLGLKGEEIPFSSRVILIADSFDAMTSDRPYRKGLPFHVAFEELVANSGTQFDPQLVEHFISAINKKDVEKSSSFYLPILDINFSKKAA